MKQNIASIADRIGYIQNTLKVIDGKWKLPLLMSMHEGKSRFRDLQRSVSGITTRVLSKELKDLERSKLITRTVKEDQPVSVEYKLTAYSKTLTPIVDEMIKWGKRHPKHVSKMESDN